MDSRSVLLDVMRKKVKFNHANFKLQCRYSAIDQALLDALEDGHSIDLHELRADAIRIFGRDIPKSRVRPHVTNKESNAINNWLKNYGLEIYIENNVLKLKDV
jgi:hypothetical protein